MRRNRISIVSQAKKRKKPCERVLRSEERDIYRIPAVTTMRMISFQIIMILPLFLKRYLTLTCSKLTIAGISKPGNDIAALVQMVVNRSQVNWYIGMVFLQRFNPLR